MSLKAEATKILARSQPEEFPDYFKSLSRTSLKDLLLSLSPEDQKKVALVLLSPNPIPFATRVTDPFDVCDLMPRFFAERSGVNKGEKKYVLSVFEFDWETREYIPVSDHERAKYKTVIIPGKSDYFSIEDTGVTKWENFVPRKIMTLPKGVYESLSAFEDGSFFFYSKKTLFKLACDEKLSSIVLPFRVSYVFPLESDKLLASPAREKEASVILTRNLEVIRTIELLPARMQLSKTKFVTPSPKGVSKVWRYTPEGSVELQEVPGVETNLFHDTLICSEEGRPEFSSVWRFEGEYRKMQTIKTNGNPNSIGSSLFSVEPDMGGMGTGLWKLGHFGVRKFQEVSELNYPELLPSTKNTRTPLVRKLEKYMSSSPVEIVDIVVGFL